MLNKIMISIIAYTSLFSGIIIQIKNKINIPIKHEINIQIKK